MSVRKVKIKNKTGIHARPASRLAKKAGEFEAEIKLIYKGQEADVRSIMGVMSLAVTSDSRVTLKAEGEDAKEALDAIEGMIENRFGEAR